MQLKLMNFAFPSTWEWHRQIRRARRYEILEEERPGTHTDEPAGDNQKDCLAAIRNTLQLDSEEH